MKNNYLIREFTEFNLQRMGSDAIPMATHVDNPELSTDGFDRHTANIQTQNVRLNSILGQVVASGDIYNYSQDRIIDGQDISNLIVQKIVITNDIDLNIYISFDIGETNYWGVIENFIKQPILKSEAFRDSNLYLPKEWIIKTKGVLIKAINQWMQIKSGDYLTLKEIICVSKDSGSEIIISEGQRIEVIRTVDNNKILISYNNNICWLFGRNYFFFNYWFEYID